MEQFNTPFQSYSGWNVNQSYLTPSYMSNFRPTYDQAGTRENPFTRNQSMFESMYRYGPGNFAYGADSLVESSAHAYNISTTPFDASMSILQNVAIPVAAWYGASKLGAGALGGRVGGFMAGQGMRAATGGFGAVAGRVGLGGVARGGVGVAAGMSSGAAAVGGFAGATLAPVAAGALLGAGINNMFMDPYVSTRRGMDALRANTAFQFISGEGASETGGFGMSAARAQKISQRLSEAGQGDLSLSGATYNEIADNMMRSGIFQEVGDMDTNRIVEGVKQATSVLKMISRITGDSDIQAGVKTLATLKMGGLSDIQEMGRAVDSIRRYSGISGVSFDQLVDTVGNQGMVMAQQQGIRGATGMLASSAAYAGFTSARRAGVLSNAQSKSLGGEEGMTQNAMTATYRMMNSPYARMVMQSNSGFEGNMTDVFQRWGSQASADPIGSEGDWFANQSFYKETYMNRYDSNRITMELLRTEAKARGLNPDDGRVLASIAQGMGMSSEEFRSASLLDKSRQDPRSRLHMEEAIRVANRSDHASALQQDNLGLRGVPVLGAAQEVVVKGSADLLRFGAEVMSPVTSTIAGISDSLEATLASARGMATPATAMHVINKDGESIAARFVSREEYKSRLGGNFRVGEEYVTKTRKSTKHHGLIAKLNSLIASGDSRLSGPARKALLLLTDGDTEGFMREYESLDVMSKGFLSGSDIDYRQKVHYEKIKEDVDRGLLSAETGVSLTVKTDNTLRDVNVAALSGESAVADMVDSYKDSPDELYRTIGISANDVKGMSASARKAFVVDSVMKFFEEGPKKAAKAPYMSIKDGGALPAKRMTEDERVQKMFQTMGNFGFSQDEIGAYSTGTQREYSDMAERLDNAYGDNHREAIKMARDIKTFLETDQSIPEATTTDHSYLKDIGELNLNMGKLVENVGINVTALQENTRAQIMSINSNKGFFSRDITMDDLRPMDNEVGNSTGVNR